MVVNYLEEPTLARPAWISFEDQKAKVIAMPDRESLAFPVEESLIVEYYSRSVSR